MEEVCCIIDCEGFHVKINNKNGTFRKEFLVRELAYVKIKEGTVYEPRSYHFDLKKYKWETFSQEDKSTISYQTNNLHGLSFYAKPEEGAKGIEELSDLVKDIHKKCCVPGVAEAIAFKGGHVERDILLSLDIPDLNLQSYGCPKFKDLNAGTLTYNNSCNFHLKRRGIHCARAEVAAFQTWLRKELGYSATV